MNHFTSSSSPGQGLPGQPPDENDLTNIRNVVLFSGGVGSWAAAKRVAAKYGAEGLVLLFTDTNTEDEDLYRFLPEAAQNVGGKLVDYSDGRDVWQVFHDQKMMGSTRVDMCSRELKRERAQKWIRENCDPDLCTVHVGIDWSESHRFERMGKWWKPYALSAPMTEPPYLAKQDVITWLRSEGIEPPRLYAMGFKHNNCGGFCIKAGHGQFAHLLRTLPERYHYHEEKEREFREMVGKDVSILRDRRGGTSSPFTLKDLRERIEAQQPIDEWDWGACACIDPDDEETEEVGVESGQ